MIKKLKYEKRLKMLNKCERNAKKAKAFLVFTLWGLIPFYIRLYKENKKMQTHYKQGSRNLWITRIIWLLIDYLPKNCKLIIVSLN